jgi:elongation factor G
VSSPAPAPPTHARRPRAHGSAFVFKTIADPYAGRLSLFRVVSGTLRGDTTVQNVGAGAAERLGTVNLLAG